MAMGLGEKSPAGTSGTHPVGLVWGWAALASLSDPPTPPRRLGRLCSQRIVGANGKISLAGFGCNSYACGRMWARTAIHVSIVAGSVQLSRDGQVIRVHPIRHDRSRELGVFAKPKGGPVARIPPPATSASYRNSVPGHAFQVA